MRFHLYVYDCSVVLFFFFFFFFFSDYQPVGLKTLLREYLSEPEFYGDLVYFKKLM